MQPKPESFARRRHGLAAWQLSRLTTHMRQHLREPIHLGKLAKLIDLSRAHVCTAFRRAAGVTLRQWLARERIVVAQSLLRDPLRSITEIGLEVGFNTPSAFANRFRLITGLSPTEYRRLHPPEF